MKIKAIIISLLLACNCAFASWNVDFWAGEFYNKDGSLVDETLNYAIVVDMGNYGFSDIELSQGDSFVAKNFINSDNEYKTLITGSLKNDSGMYIALSDENWSFDNSDYDFSGDEEVAIVVWSSTDDSYTISGGENYCVFTPSLAGNDLSDGNPWVIQSSNTDETYWYMATVGDAEGSIASSFATLSQTVTAVPEPSTYAVIFGAIALGFVAYRRRK